jgi:hypothetical protein
MDVLSFMIGAISGGFVGMFTVGVVYLNNTFRSNVSRSSRH